VPTLLAGVAGTLLWRALAVPLGLALTTLVVRSLDSRDAATFFYAQSLIIALTPIVGLGAGKYVVRLLGVARSRGLEAACARSLVRLLYWNGFLSAVLVVGICLAWLAATSNPIEQSHLRLAVATAVAGRGLASFSSDVHRGIGRVRTAAWLGSVDGTALTLLTLGLWSALSPDPLPIGGVLLAAGAAWLPGALFGSRVYSSPHQFITTAGHSEPISWRLLIPESAPLLISSLVTGASTQMPIWILGSRGSLRGVTEYAVAQRVTGVALLPLLSVSSVLQPLIARAWAEGKLSDLERTLRSTATLTTVPALLVLGGLLLGGQQLTSMLFGRGYIGVQSIAVLMCVGAAANAATGPCALLHQLTGGQRAVLRIQGGWLMLQTVLLLTGATDADTAAAVVSFTIFGQNAHLMLRARMWRGIWTGAGVLHPAALRRLQL
jgi:O-antigen/teichoic acid export membrane protein